MPRGERHFWQGVYGVVSTLVFEDTKNDEDLHHITIIDDHYEGKCVMMVPRSI